MVSNPIARNAGMVAFKPTKPLTTWLDMIKTLRLPLDMLIAPTQLSVKLSMILGGDSCK
jgi:hypothetical protein